MRNLLYRLKWYRRRIARREEERHAAEQITRLNQMIEQGAKVRAMESRRQDA